jgi:hypothetical protein
VLFSKLGGKKIQCIKGQTGDNWADKTLFSWGSGRRGNWERGSGRGIVLLDFPSFTAA